MARQIHFAAIVFTARRNNGMTTTPLPPAIEPVAWFEYARKKPTLKRLVFDRTSRSRKAVCDD